MGEWNETRTPRRGSSPERLQLALRRLALGVALVGAAMACTHVGVTPQVAPGDDWALDGGSPLADCPATPLAPDGSQSWRGWTRPRYEPEVVTRGLSTRASLEAGVQGLLIVRCLVTVSGQARECHIVKSLPPLDQALIARLESIHFEPATRCGVPTEIPFTMGFTFRP